MNKDYRFINGNDFLFFQQKNPEILVSINKALSEIDSVRKGIKRKELKKVGEINLRKQSPTTTYFHLHYLQRGRDLSLYPLKAIMRLFDKKGEYRLEEKLGEKNYAKVEKDGDLVSLRDKLDFDYNEGLDKLIENLIIEGKIHMIKYYGKIKQPRGKDLDFSCVSNHLRENKEIDFSLQLYGFATDNHFTGFRENPGQSGWDCNVGGASLYGVKYQRIAGSSHENYYFKNNVGSFKCALGILENAKGIKILGLENTIKMSEKSQDIPF